MKNIIETKQLCKTYGNRRVVDDLNLHLPESCVYGFLGPNGAGKSTTIKMLLGLIHPTGGSIRLFGQPLTETNRISLLRQTGSIIESPAGYLHLTAEENLKIVADLKGVSYKDIDRVLEIVSYFVPWGYYVPLSGYEVKVWNQADHTVLYGTRAMNWGLLSFSALLAVFFLAAAWRVMKNKEM